MAVSEGVTGFRMKTEASKQHGFFVFIESHKHIIFRKVGIYFAGLVTIKQSRIRW